jgi:hypothetical protein
VRGGVGHGTAYAKGDLVLQGGIVYVCMVAHTAGTFATDLAAGKWGQVTANAHRRDHELLADIDYFSDHRPGRDRRARQRVRPANPSSYVNFSTGYNNERTTPTLISTVRDVRGSRSSERRRHRPEDLGIAAPGRRLTHQGLHITSDDTVARVLQVVKTIGGVDYLLGEIDVAIGAGSDGATAR